MASLNHVKDKKFFHVSVKGLVFDDQGRIMLLQEPSGFWDLPGGRMEHGQSFRDALERECHEEMGVNCTITDEKPHWMWSAPDRNGVWRVILCYRMKVESFRGSDECVGHAFYDKAGLDSIRISPQTRKLREFLEK